jgi:hypothetical protein
MIEWRCTGTTKHGYPCRKLLGRFYAPPEGEIKCDSCRTLNVWRRGLDKPPPERVELRQPAEVLEARSHQADGPFDAERG